RDRQIGVTRTIHGIKKSILISIRNRLPCIQIEAEEQEIVEGTGWCVENKSLGGTLKDRISLGLLAAILLFSLTAGGSGLCAQESPATPPANGQDKPAGTAATPAQDPPAEKAPDGATSAKPDSPQPKVEPEQSGKQTNRILWIIPNYRSVSANTYLPPQASRKSSGWLPRIASTTRPLYMRASFLECPWRESRNPNLIKAPPAMETTLRTLLPMTR